MSTAGFVCNREVVVCEPTDKVREAARRMLGFHAGDVVVVTTRDGVRVPIGILTDRDIAVRVVALGIDPDTCLVGEVMSVPLVTARESESLHDVLQRMRVAGVRRVPVVDEHDGLQGIVALDDVLGLVAEEMADLTSLVAREASREERALSR